MDHFRAMRVFVRVAELGSLSAASADLGQARGAASAIVSELEKHYGVQLLERTTRRLRLTEEGVLYLDRARAILADIAKLEDEVGAAERAPRGLLRVQIPPGLTRLVVAPGLARFSDAYPEITLQILSRNALPDFAIDRIDAAVVVGELPELDIIARSVGGIPLVTVAAPAYLDRFGTPVTPGDLADHRCVAILSTTSGRAVPWRFCIGGRDEKVTVSGPMAFEAAEAAVAVAIRGAGILQLAHYLVFQDITEGRLVPILKSYRPSPEKVHIVHSRHRLKPRKLRLFEEFLMDQNRRMRRRWPRTPAAPAVPMPQEPATDQPAPVPPSSEVRLA